MNKIDFQAFRMMLSDIYNLKDDLAKGRLISLGSSLMTAFYNVFITGIFYTGFLSMYGMSITGVGIISFIPYVASCFSVFSPMVLRRFKKRKGILLAAKIYYYAMYILATTIMPVFVQGETPRLICFAVILFLGYSVYALFSPGLTTWFYVFYPADNERRTRYITLNQIFSSVRSSVVLIFSSVLADAVAGSPHQHTLILTFRYLAFFLVLIDVGMQACAKEYPYPESGSLRLHQVFTLPFRYRKFLLCMLFMFFWNYLSNLNNGLWHYHLLNHMQFSYTLINAMSVMYTLILVFTSSFWRKLLRRYSWIKTFGIATLIWVPTEILFFMMTPERTFLYIPLCTVQNLLSVGLNLAYANVLYMNLPEDNSTAHIAFYTIGCNAFAFLGLMTGTAISGITGDTTMPFLGMSIYSVQFTCLARAVTMFTVGFICTRFWRAFTRDVDIADVEAQDETSRIHRAMRKRRFRYALAQLRQKIK